MRSLRKFGTGYVEGMIATLRWNTMRVDGARFRAGDRFVVLREFTAMGDNGPVLCLTLVDERGEFAMQVDKCDVDLEWDESDAVRRDSPTA